MSLIASNPPTDSVVVSVLGLLTPRNLMQSWLAVIRQTAPTGFNSSINAAVT